MIKYQIHKKYGKGYFHIKGVVTPFPTNFHSFHFPNHPTECMQIAEGEYNNHNLMIDNVSVKLVMLVNKTSLADYRAEWSALDYNQPTK